MNKNLLFVTLATAMISGSLSAQTEPEKKEPVKIKVYSPDTSNDTKKDNSYKWAVKTDLLAFVTGEFPIIGEYRFSKKFSVEGSAGITYAFIPNGLLFEDELDGQGEYESKAAMGSAFRGMIKFYPSSDYDAIEGWSFGIQLFTKTTNRDYEGYEGGSGAEWEGKQDTKTKTGAALIISKQIFQDSNIAFESYIGIGIANSTREYYVDQYNPEGPNFVVPMESEKTAPSFQLGFKIGFGN